MQFFNDVGKMAIGSRLRLLTEKITEDAGQIYAMYGIDMQPKWFPVFYVLTQNEQGKTITAIAQEIGHSHPSVSKIIREMTEADYVSAKNAHSDKRSNKVQLTAKGKEVALKIKDQYSDVNIAIEALSAQAANDLWKAVEEWEFLLEHKSLLTRVKEQKKLREGSGVEIVAYNPTYKDAFYELNVEWITQYFKMEKADYMALEDPEEYILSKGGHIFVALYKGTPLGVCALIKMDDPEYDYELAKMSVSPLAQGQGMGWLLGRAILEKAKELGGRNVYLESNTLLKPAISLYHKLGFQKVAGRPTPYERCNIQMVVELNANPS